MDQLCANWHQTIETRFNNQIWNNFGMKGEKEERHLLRDFLIDFSAFPLSNLDCICSPWLSLFIDVSSMIFNQSIGSLYPAEGLRFWCRQLSKLINDATKSLLSVLTISELHLWQTLVIMSVVTSLLDRKCFRTSTKSSSKLFHYQLRLFLRLQLNVETI